MEFVLRTSDLYVVSFFQAVQIAFSPATIDSAKTLRRHKVLEVKSLNMLSQTKRSAIPGPVV